MKQFLARPFSILVRLSKILSRKGLYPFLERHFEQIPSGSNVLNVGAGGAVEELLKRHAEARSFDVVSFDIDPARRPDMVGNIAEFDFGDRRFDVVVMSEVLEHVRSPEKAIKKVHSILSPGGTLILSTPFILPIHDRPHDYYRFTRYGLEWLLHDFSDVTILERNSWPEAINVLPVRLIMERHWSCRLAAPFAVGLALVLSPIAMMLGKVVKSNFMTTGYVARAVK